MKRKAIFQFRYTGDVRPWADIPVQYDSIEPVDAEYAARCATRALVEYAHLVEVRWTWEGSTQGHYVNRDQAQDAIRAHRLQQEVRQWQQAARSAQAALEAFYLQLERWVGVTGLIQNSEFMAALRALSVEGLDGWFDGSPLHIDKLHDLLVEGVWEDDTRSIVERVFNVKLAASAEDDAYLEAQDDEYGAGWGMRDYT